MGSFARAIQGFLSCVPDVQGSPSLKEITNQHLACENRVSRYTTVAGQSRTIKSSRTIIVLVKSPGKPRSDHAKKKRSVRCNFTHPS